MVTLSVQRGRFSNKLTDVPVSTGLPNDPNSLSAELDTYVHVLLGRLDPPNDDGYMTLLEYADAVYARACEIEMLIHRAERNRNIVKGSPMYHFRTGELRSFLELSKHAAERGSRRLTNERLMYDQARDAGVIRE